VGVAIILSIADGGVAVERTEDDLVAGAASRPNGSLPHFAGANGAASTERPPRVGPLLLGRLAVLRPPRSGPRRRCRPTLIEHSRDRRRWLVSANRRALRQ